MYNEKIHQNAISPTLSAVYIQNVTQEYAGRARLAETPIIYFTPDSKNAQ